MSFSVVIRADANSLVGMGHIMRCLSIADSFVSVYNDVRIMFVLADDSVAQLVNDKGYETFVLGSDYSVMDDELSLWTDQLLADVVVVDSYYVTASYFKKIKDYGVGKLVYIDDLCSSPYPVDIIINYNVYAPDLDYEALYSSSEYKKPMIMSGPTYTPLRSMFRGVEKKNQKRIVENVILSTGGADSYHIAVNFIKELLANNDMVFNYHILIGALNTDRDEIESLVLNNDRITIHENVSDMRTLLSKMDIAVSAAGTTLYEICTCGVPLITYVIADNQIQGAAAFEKMGLTESLGDLRNEKNPSLTILCGIGELAADYERRCEIGERMQMMIDGYGADRIINGIMEASH